MSRPRSTAPLTAPCPSALPCRLREPAADGTLHRTDPVGHVIAMGVFGFAGYWAYQWDQRAAVLLAQKRAEIAERRERAEGSSS